MTYEELLQIKPEISAISTNFPSHLDGQFYIQSFPPHALIHQKNTELTKVGILLDGMFRVVNELQNGNIFMIEINEPVSFTGEIALLSGEKRTSVTIETITDCKIAFLPVDVFEEWIMNDLNALRFLSVLVAKKLYSTSYHRGERMFYSTRYIILKYILENEEPVPYMKERWIIRKTRQQMSEEIGMSVNTVNRTLQGFRQSGLIGMDKGKIVLTKENQECAYEALQVFIAENRNGAK